MAAKQWIRVTAALLVAGCFVAAAAAATAAKPTLKVSTRNLPFGKTVTFAGKAGTKKGTPVNLLAQPCGFTASAVTLRGKTGAKGAFHFAFRPAISTIYRSSSAGQTSAPVKVWIQPLVQIRRVGAGRYAVDVSTGAGSFLKGKTIVVQKNTGKGWKTAGTAPLRINSEATAIIAVSSATARATVPKGAKVRAFLPARSAAPCYEASASTVIAG